MRRYQIKCHLPEIEDEDSLYTAALYGAEEHQMCIRDRQILNNAQLEQFMEAIQSDEI